MVLTYDLLQQIETGLDFDILFPLPVHLKSVKICYSYDSDFTFGDYNEYGIIESSLSYKSLLTSSVPIIVPNTLGPDVSSNYYYYFIDMLSFKGQYETEPTSSLISVVKGTVFERKLFYGSDYVKKITINAGSTIPTFVNNFRVYLLVEYDLIDKLPNM